MSRHGWLTPNSIPSVTVGRCIQIPDNPEIIAAVTGALYPLTKAYNWEKFGLIEPGDIAYAMLLMLDSYFNSECGAMNCADVISCMLESGLFYDTTDKEYRVVDGVPQWSWDGVTWSDILGDSNAQPTAPTLQPTEGADDWDKACLAATRAANVFDELHKQTWGAMQAGFAGAIATFFNVVSETIATLIGLHYGEAGGLVASEILRLGTSDPNRFVSAGLTSQAREDFICLLMDNFVVNSGVVTFNFGAVVDNVVTAVSGGDGLDLYLLLQYVKATGLDAAGQVNSTDTANCDACGGAWCYEFDFSTGANDWVVNSGYGTLISTGFSVVRPSGESYRGLVIGRTFSEAIITGVEFDYINASGGVYYWFDPAYKQAAVPAGAGTLTIPEAAFGEVSSVSINWDTLSASGTGIVTKARVYGIGFNPFGGSNC